MIQLTDSYNRKMDYLRISVTDRCNFRCQYCMPENIEFKDKRHILTLEEMLTFAEACLQLGVTKVRVTGGEPLVRRDRKSTRLNSSHANISYAVFSLKKKQ